MDRPEFRSWMFYLLLSVVSLAAGCAYHSCQGGPGGSGGTDAAPGVPPYQGTSYGVPGSGPAVAPAGPPTVAPGSGFF